MKKQIIKLSLIASLAIGFTGCFSNSGNLQAPVTKRAQDVTPKAMQDVKANAHKSFEKKLEQPKYTHKVTMTLGQLKSKNRDLYNIIYPLAVEAKKMYAQRNLPADIKKNGPQWLTGDVNTLNITLAQTSSKKFNGRYSPFNDLLILNYNNSIDKNKIRFLIGHEFGHAIALHVSEDKTQQLKMLQGASDAADLALDVSLNKLYIKLKKQQPQVAQMLDLSAKKAKGVLYTDKDIQMEKKIFEERKNSFAAKMAIKSGQKDKLEALGVNLEIPVETLLALKALIKDGLDTTGAINALKGGVNFASANVLAITQHPKKQELEADLISIELNKRAGYNVKSAACKLFSSKQEAGVFDAHPSHADRRKNLGCGK